MAIGSTKFHPSIIEDEIYDILDSNPEFIVSSEEYTKEAIEKVIEYMSNCKSEWSLIDDPHPDCEGGSVSICWIEEGHLHHIVLSYRTCYEV